MSLLLVGVGGSVVAGGGAALPLKVVFEGDSITWFSSAPISMANQWRTANPSVPSANLSVSSARIRSNGGNSLDERRAQVVSERTADGGYALVLCILIGANDLYAAASAAAWQSSLLQLLADYRTDNPGIKIGVGTILPIDEAQQPARAGHNARRATVNAWMRSQVGSTIDFIIPYGDGHPVMGLDATAATGAFSDGLHPSAGGYSYMLANLSAALDPVVAGANGTVPAAFSFADFATATASTQYTAATIVTGMGMGQSANAAVTGAGEVARGAQAFGTGPTAVFNGDILTSRVTSSASNGGLVQHTLAVGTRSDTWDITTAATTATTVWDQAYSVATLKYPSAREVKGPLNGESGYNSSRGARADKGYDVSVANKRYFEMNFTTGTSGSNGGPWTVSVLGSTTANGVRPGGASGNGNQAISYRSDGIVYNNGVQTSGLPTFGAADTIGVAIDYGADKVWFLKNGTSINGDPAAGTGGYALTLYASTKWFAGCVCQRNEGHVLNCGQDPFTNAPPSGFVAYG